MKLKRIVIPIILIFSMLIYGCNKNDKYPIDKNNTLESKAKVDTEVYSPNYKGEKSKVLPYVITDKKILALTIQGMGNEQSLTQLLDELDKYNMKATFFVSGIKVAEEPQLAKMIVDRGHELGDATLTGQNLTNVDYTEKIKEIKKSKEEIEKHTGVEVKYLRPGHKEIDDEVLLASKECGYEYIVTYNLIIQKYNEEIKEEIKSYIEEKKKRGSIFLLSLDNNPDAYKSIELIYEKLNEKSFSIVSLDEVVNIYDSWEENKYILAENWYENDSSDEYNIIKNGSKTEKKIALSFDDWGSDDTVDSILDTLDKYNVKATFFLRANGVEHNPSLAYTISQRGHEIGSHTYSHPDLNTISANEVKEEIIKAHEVITEAINKEPKKYLRPPRGIVDDYVAKAASQCGYKDIIMYGPSALDWKAENSAEYISEYMINNTENGDILLLHILDNINTGEALPSIIEGLEAKGFTFVTVGELIE